MVCKYGLNTVIDDCWFIVEYHPLIDHGLLGIPPHGHFNGENHLSIIEFPWSWMLNSIFGFRNTF
jgi:hypothetical protein